MKKRALVTGGGGFLGLYIVEALLADNWEVTVFCRGHYPALNRLNVTVINGDLINLKDVLIACQNMNVVFHVAAKTGLWGDYAEFYQTNVVGTHNIIKACQQHAVQKLIYTSSPSVLSFYEHLQCVNESLPYPTERISNYQETKMLAEKAVIAANSEKLQTTVLRPHAIWGPRDTQLFAAIIEQMKSGKLKIIGDGENSISVSYVENTAQAHLQAAASDKTAGQIYFINELEPVKLWPWINELLRSIDLPPVTRKVPYKLAYVVAAICESVYKLLPFLGEPPISRVLVSVCGKDHYFDVSKAQRDFNFTNVIPMEEAKKRFADYFKGNH